MARAVNAQERRWYREPGVWVCLFLFAVLGLAQLVFGLPFRILGSLWNMLF